MNLKIEIQLLNKMSESKTQLKKSRYQKVNQREHVLLRSEVYIGSINKRSTEEYISDYYNQFKITKQNIHCSPGFMRIFIEPLSNAIDNVARSKGKKKCTEIKININQETGETIIYNDGEHIPIDKNNDEGLYNHTLIFGHLLTSSNYNDNEERVDISGLNGMGVKLTCIFSLKFIVEGYDPDNKLSFYQEWTNNMESVSEPIIKKQSKGIGYTKITWFPDFEKFKFKKYTDDIIKLFAKYACDTAMLTKINVYFNDVLIPIKNLGEYANLYLIEPTSEIITIKTKDSDVLITPSEQYESISFVNGICTTKGGTHVDNWSEAFFRPIVEKYKKQINIKDVKQFFRLFVVVSLNQPRFESQSKMILESEGPKATVKKSQITTICKWSNMSKIEDIIRMKELGVLKKAEGKKKGFTKVEGLDPANNAGTKFSKDCSLILTEGLSAKTFAVKGIESGVFGKTGRDWFGIMALRGKCISKTEKVLLFNGQIKEAQYITIGDKLINENGEQTIVENIITGLDKMYDIIQSNGITYTVNSQHTLTLKIVGQQNIKLSNKLNRWTLVYFDINTLTMKSKTINYIKNENEKKILKSSEFLCTICDINYSNRSNLLKHYKKFHTELSLPEPKPYTVHNKSFKTKEEGYQEILNFKKSITIPNFIDIDIQSYINLNNKSKQYMKGFKLQKHVEWEYKNVSIDPYIFGMWLGDSSQNGRSFSSEDVELINEWVKWGNKNNCEIIHNSKDSFNIQRCGIDSNRIELGSINNSNENCNGCKHKLSYACSNDLELKINNQDRIIQLKDKHNIKILKYTHPFIEQLNKYNLVNNKHIPIDYIINDKNTRLQLLAGIIDTNGYLGKDGRYEIVQCDKHKNIIDSLIYLTRSLGIECKYFKKKSYPKGKNKKQTKIAHCIMLFGDQLHEIPTRLKRKQYSPCWTLKGTHKLQQHKEYSTIQIIEKDIGEYVGIQVNNTHRFLLNDFTITHNCLNVRNAKPTSIAKNSVIGDIIKAIGLRHELDYTDDKNYKTLRYGKLILLADADCDGIHIGALIQNLFHVLFPSLLQRNEPYIYSLLTPIVKVKLQKKELLFFDEQQYYNYVKDYSTKYPNKKINKKYYKGLGTSSDKEIKDVFGKKLLEFTLDDKTSFNMNKAFSNKESDARKTWLENYNPNHISFDWSKDLSDESKSQTFSDFINFELIKYSINDCARSIPHIMDGMKESHRKVLYSCFLRNLKYSGQSLKVAQLSGYVAEKSGYHHGEQNLYQTITKMAHNFVGSNNIPLLFPDGQFGGLSAGGKDAANARYIFTKLDKLTRIIYDIRDDPLLEQNEDDGDIVEPKYYVPLLPMVLVNGVLCGIGTGSSCNIPAYNPLDLINCMKTWIENDGKIITIDEDNKSIISILPELIPWYQGFNGKIEKISEHKFISYGTIIKEKNTKIVTELPVGMWIDNFKEQLDQHLEEKQIKSVKNNSTANSAKFTITEDNDGFICSINSLKLYTYLSTSNMVLFTNEGKLKKFNTIDEIIDHFCKVRYSYYIKRKQFIISDLKSQLQYLGNKRRFLEEFMSGELKIFNGKQSRDEDDIIKDLEIKGYDKNIKDSDNENNTGNYNYLLRMPINNLTTKKLKSLIDEILSITKKYDITFSTTEKKMWLDDLSNFEIEYKKWLK
jgi:DNA gyrase/topoisomerase IV subunit B